MLRGWNLKVLSKSCLHMRVDHDFVGGKQRLKFNALSHWRRKCAAAQLGKGLGSPYSLQPQVGMGFFCYLQWQTPFARAALCWLSLPRTVRNCDLLCQSPAPSTWTHGAQGVGAFPSTLSSGQEWEQRREWHSFRLSPGRELEVVMFSSL